MNRTLHILCVGLCAASMTQAQMPPFANRSGPTGQTRVQPTRAPGLAGFDGSLRLASFDSGATPRPLAAPDPLPGIAERLVPVAGVVRAHEEATLSSRMAGRISRMPLREGEAFRRGQVLVELDCDKPRAETRAAAAQVAIQARMLDTNTELDSFNAIGKNELAISQAQHDKARAEHEALAAQLKDCTITAPFAGRVTEAMARTHETVTVSQPLLRIFDQGALELDIIVPSAWLQWLKAGQRFDFTVEETGETLPASVARMSARVDPVSKTVRIVGRIASGARVLPGMSGQARFPARGI